MAGPGSVRMLDIDIGSGIDDLSDEGSNLTTDDSAASSSHAQESQKASDSAELGLLESTAPASRQNMHVSYRIITADDLKKVQVGAHAHSTHP